MDKRTRQIGTVLTLLVQIMTQLQAENKRAQEQRETIFEWMGNPEERVANEEERMTNKGEQMASLQQRMASLEQRMASLEQRMANVEKRVASVEEQMASVQEQQLQPLELQEQQLQPLELQEQQEVEVAPKTATATVITATMHRRNKKPPEPRHRWRV